MIIILKVADQYSLKGGCGLRRLGWGGGYVIILKKKNLKLFIKVGPRLYMISPHDYSCSKHIHYQITL